jgi:hypothetical protein
MPDLYKYNGTIIAKNGLLARAQTCCCGDPPPPCDCDCYEVAVNGKFGFNPDNYSDPNNEGWGSGFVYNCGSGGASYSKLDYPVRIGSITISISGSQAVVSQTCDTGCAGAGYFWPDATLTFGEDGCPTGIELGEPVFSCYPIPYDYACNPIYGGTDEEVCQKARDFLDANPPVINFRPCVAGWSCSPSGCTEVNAGYVEFESQSACEAACFQGYTCAYNSGCTSIGYTTDAQTYMTAAQCAAACYETYTCATTQGCVWQGYALSGQTLQQCQSICTIQGYNCDNANACVALYNVNGEFSTLGACNAVCLERATCDSISGCQYVGYGTTGNLYSNCAQDCQILSYECSLWASCIPLYNSTAGQYTDAASCAAGCQTDYQCYSNYYCYFNGYSTNAQSYEACAANCPQQQMQMPEWVDISEPTPENYEVRQYLTTQSVVSSRPAPPKTLEEQDPTGPGTFLSKTLEKIGIKSSPTCSCKARALRMNEMGNDWCDENIETIVGWLREEAEKRKLPFIDMAGTLLVKRAISLSRTAKKKQAKNESTATDRTDS